MTGANLSGANLSNTNLSGANLYGVNLTEANRNGAYLGSVILPDEETGRLVYGSVLVRTNLSRALLVRAS